MRPWPLNIEVPFEPWPHFDPGRFIDFNPSFVRLDAERAYAVIRRDRVPPVPGKGTVWAVAVDAQMQPTGRPFPLVADGEDPRAVLVNGRVLVFYVLFERDEQQRITGTSMVMAEYDPQAEPWKPLRVFKMPKYPLGGGPPGRSNPGWEKNWVPFVLDDERVALIYAHAPWQVIVLNVGAGGAGASCHFEQAWRSDGLRWPYGAVRGGTPPLPWGPGQLITFFHSSEVVGSRKIYVVGACVFADTAPFAPLQMTPRPLLAAPYSGGMHRHGWPVAASVLFPLGAQSEGDGLRLLCGVDDGEIASTLLPRAAVQAALTPWPAPPSPRFTQLADEDSLQADAPIVVQPPGAPSLPPDLPLVRFAHYLSGGGRTLLVVAREPALFMAGLAADFERVEVVLADAEGADWAARTLAANGLQNVTLHRPPGVPARAGCPAARAPWALTALDEAGFTEVDLLHIDTPDPVAVLRGLQHTLQRDRPAMLLNLSTDATERAAVETQLQALGYGMESLFPRTPRAALALPAERREQWRWFV